MIGISGHTGSEFSFNSRETALRRFSSEIFDLLIVGGGITGAAVARDAASRGLKVALVEKGDFAIGTSSRSSKLIHGGLRYLQNLEFRLVFESLSERALLLKTAPNLVRSIPFYFPVYAGDKPGRFLLGLGMLLYDILSLFRAPGLHKNYNKQEALQMIPQLREEGLRGVFRYYDASMWDDVLTVATLRSAQQSGAAIANYVEAIGPQWTSGRISGFRLRNLEAAQGQGEIDIKAHQTISCVGPWTDVFGLVLNPQWKPWLSPSRGIHLVFDLKRIPVPGAVVMGSPKDGRISFVIPRPDVGPGVVIVGTTDGPVNAKLEQMQVEEEDVWYLLQLLNKTFPRLKLSQEDILSAYVGVRPLIGGAVSGTGSLQKVSREHHIDEGPGGTVVVAGGKYTTHRRMAEEIVAFALKLRKRDASFGKCPVLDSSIRKPSTKTPVNSRATQDAMEACEMAALKRGAVVPPELISRYGGEAMTVLDIYSETGGSNKGVSFAPADPEGFPLLSSQLRFCIRNEMVMHLEDFYFRRTALFMARKDHGLPWVEMLARVWAEERGFDASAALQEAQRFRDEITRHWSKSQGKSIF